MVEFLMIIAFGARLPTELVWARLPTEEACIERVAEEMEKRALFGWHDTPETSDSWACIPVAALQQEPKP